jgi:hypothetical protein
LTVLKMALHFSASVVMGFSVTTWIPLFKAGTSGSKGWENWSADANLDLEASGDPATH